MAVTSDWQTELNGYLTGPTQPVRLGPRRIDGLGVPPMKTADVELFGQDGSYPSADFAGPRVLIVDYVISVATLALAMDALDDLNTAWAPTNTGGTLVEFHFQLPGLGHRKVLGRPRGLDPVFSEASNLTGVMRVLAEFHALEPELVVVP